MAIVLKDRVKETSTSTGTGTITLLGAVAGYQGFSAIGNGNTTYYAIVNPEDGTWEVGTGTYTSSGSTLSRTTVFESSNAGALVDFGAGTKDVFVTYPAERAIFEEPDGQTLIDGGPITILGSGVTSNPSLEAELGKFVGNVNSFGQVYNMNQNDGSSASADFVVYNDLTTDGFTNFTDMGINSSNYSSVDYPIFTPGSGYFFHDGDNLFIGTQTANKDVVLFAGGVDTANEAVRIKGSDQSVELASDLTVGGDVGAVGGTFTAPVTSTSSMAAPGATEFVTRSYVDDATSNGFHVHAPVLVATTGNLTATYNNGTSGVGATLTNSGTQVALEIDGVAMATNDRVLVWQQTTGFQNGIYVVSTVGNGSTNWVLTRAPDANTSSEGDPNSLGGGDYFFVQSGDTLGYHSYICVNTSAIVFGTTSIDFNEFSSTPQYTGGTNIDVDGQTISLTGTVAATNGGTGTSTVATGDLLYGSATNTWSKLAAGSAYKSLVMNAGGTNVEWNAVSLNQSGAVSGTLPATNGGTGQDSYAVGDMLYSGATNTLTKLSGNITTTKKFLTQTGTGSDSTDPTWGTISGSDVSGNIAGNAGSATNLAGGAANQIAYQTGAGATAFATAPTTSGTALTWNGSAFTWSTAGGATLSDDTTTNTSYYPVWANATSGTFSNAYVSSTKLSFNPSTGLLTATGFSGSTVSATTGSFSGVLTAPKTFIGRNAGAATGISWYSSSYSAWTTYMSPAAATSCGPYSNITAPSGTLVTSWGLRSFIENSSGYGWTFESGTANQVTPTVVAEIRASDGAARFAGTVTAPTFSGNATTATSAVNLSTTRADWSTNGTITAVVGQLSWKNYGNNHTIFDASASTSPSGTAVNNTNPSVAWSGSYPTLMGWNGASTYGVRVDSARYVNGGTVTLDGGFVMDTPGSGYARFSNWVNINGYFGFYSGNNGAHFYPNSGSYGAWKIDGTRNGWNGIEFGGHTSLMMNDNAQGFHRNIGGGWRFYVESGYGYFPGNVTAYWSDERLKENLQLMGREAINILGQFNAYRFNWNAKVAEIGSVIPVGKEEIGLIAQHVQRAIPDAVTVNKAGASFGDTDFDYLTINYDRITPLLVESSNIHEQDIQELKEQVRILQTALKTANLI